MKKFIALLLFLAVALFFTSCNSKGADRNTKTIEIIPVNDINTLNLLSDVDPIVNDGDINAVIEIPAGTIDKWELDKSTGQLQWELVDNRPRIVQYIGYPGNYGMIPRTLLSKEKGGDGDPLDILVLGPSVERGKILKCKLIGVLHLLDRGERDDKLIAVSTDSPMYGVSNLSELNENYQGITDILQLWFTNYKGPGKMESKGFGDKQIAQGILSRAISEYESNKPKEFNLN